MRRWTYTAAWLVAALVLLACGVGGTRSEAPPAEPPDPPIVTLVAHATGFTPSILHEKGAFTSVAVTLTNTSVDRAVSVNPLYFTIIDTGGGTHEAELGEDDKQIATLDVVPGAHIDGVVTGEGAFTAARVVFDNGDRGCRATAEVTR